MPFSIKNISVMDLSKSIYPTDQDLKYALSQYEYHLNKVNESINEVNHHVDKCNEWAYFVDKARNNLGR